MITLERDDLSMVKYGKDLKERKANNYPAKERDNLKSFIRNRRRNADMENKS